MSQKRESPLLNPYHRKLTPLAERIAIARAIVSDPRILLLDEAVRSYLTLL
jgi:ABC-type molybdate transport system ATPase subunit